MTMQKKSRSRGYIAYQEDKVLCMDRSILINQNKEYYVKYQILHLAF